MDASISGYSAGLPVATLLAAPVLLLSVFCILSGLLAATLTTQSTDQ
jgi:hypothetical protein